jgi:hypothetical protein
MVDRSSEGCDGSKRNVTVTEEPENDRCFKFLLSLWANSKFLLYLVNSARVLPVAKCQK